MKTLGLSSGLATFLTSTVLTLLPTGHDGSDRDRRRESGPTDRRLGHLEDGEWGDMSTLKQGDSTLA